MEKESFEDSEVADYLNRYFVAIKVDREERPDIDTIYMTACQALTGQGGWPLTVIMTADKKPFFAGTYFSKNAKWGRPGLMDILAFIQDKWENQRAEIIQYGKEIVEALNKPQTRRKEAKLSVEILKKAYVQLENAFDKRYGGFGGAPKFPMPHNLMFLLRYWKHFRQEKARTMAEKTLTAMRRGGIYDHLGYGFARYSTDEQWLIPHFEKMLYDNALLCYTYLEAYQCTGNNDFAQVAEEILTYIARDMADEEGGFYSAEDADSEGVEGKFYVFTKEEVLFVLGPERGQLFADFYHITSQGNFEHGSSVLNIADDFEDVSHPPKMDTDAVGKQLAQDREKLYAYREKRQHPYKDDKILTAWNALAIAAFAKAARVLKRPKYLQFACRAVEFIYRQLVRKDGRLLARYREGEAAHLAYLDDYAFLLWALLEVYEAALNKEYLRLAVRLAHDMKTLFWDEANGGFYFYGKDAEQLVVKPKELYDGAIPSGNSVAALAMLRLSDYMEDEDIAQQAERLLQFFAGEVEKYPKAYTYFLMALDYYWFGRKKIVVSGKVDQSDVWAMLRVTDGFFLPDAVVVFEHIDENASEDKEEGAIAYICEGFTCKPKICDIEEFASKIKQL
jgi:uncharacterized protein YyaL (SSP411 family)